MVKYRGARDFLENEAKWEKEQDRIRKEISGALKNYHKKLVDSGAPSTYILTMQDAIEALHNAPSLERKPRNSGEVRDIFRKYYSILSLKEILEGVELPFK